MIFEALGGLSNRLRGIFSRYQPGMKVVWKRYWDAANGHFLDVFEPIDGLTFVEDGAEEASCGAVGTDNAWHANYRLLRPVRAVQERIDAIRASLVVYDAMHVRRTDHLAHCNYNRLTPTHDGEFIAWAKECANPIFLATDNVDTRKVMLDAIGPRLVWQGPMEQRAIDSERNTSLADAVVDMFVCVHAREFMGSAHSSFSEIIQHIRSVKES